MLRSLGFAAAAGVVASAILTLLALALGVLIESERLAFTSKRDGDYEIYLLDLARSFLFNVTRSQNNDLNPVWSPDGTRLAFVKYEGTYGEVYVIDTVRHRLINISRSSYDDTDPAWSSDSARLAFVSTRDGNFEIYAADIDSGQVVNLTQHKADDIDPVWRGKRLAFVSNRTGSTEVYMLELVTGETTNISRSGGGDFMPAWSPDHCCIAYLSDRNELSEIFITDVERGVTEKLNTRLWVYSFTWLPDSRRLAFETYSRGSREIFVIDRLTMETRNISNTAMDEYSPVWSPRGIHVAYVAGEESWEIYVMDTQSGERSNVSTYPGWDAEPVWWP